MISFFNELNLVISITLSIVSATFISLFAREFRTILRLLTCSAVSSKTTSDPSLKSLSTSKVRRAPSKKSLHKIFILFTPLKNHFFHLFASFWTIAVTNYSLRPVSNLFTSVSVDKNWGPSNPLLKLFILQTRVGISAEIFTRRYVVLAIIIDNVPYAYYFIFHLWLLFFSLHPAQCNFGIRPTIYRIYRNTSR